jgi:glycosyltransferase involved in cell wall biosynthesis
MRVLLINNFGSIRGGADKVFLDTANSLVKVGLEVAVYYSGDSKENEYLDSRVKIYLTNDIFMPGNNFFKAGLKFIRNRESERDLIAAMNEFNPDIVHLHIFQSRLSSAIVYQIKKRNIKMVMTVHEYKMLCPVYTHLKRDLQVCNSCKPFKYSPCIKNKCVEGNLLKSILMAYESFHRDVFYSYVRNVDVFIMVSQFIREMHFKIYPKYGEKFHFLYNFVNQKDFSSTLVRGEYLLYFGRLSPEKGLNLLLDAAKMNPSIPIKIVGAGSEMIKLQNKAVLEKIINVEFLGFQSGGNLKKLIAESRFVVVPSIWYENNPMNVIESFFSGKPVFGSMMGGIPELVKPGETGFLFNHHEPDALGNLLEDKWDLPHAEYDDLARNCILFAQSNFNESKIINEIISIYNDLLTRV